MVISKEEKAKMDFDDVLKNLWRGIYISREAWDGNLQYLAAMPGIKYIWKIVVDPELNAGNWLPTIEDYQATDYYVLDKEHSVEPSELE